MLYYHVIAYVPRGWKVNLVAWLFIMPFAGWLADVRCGRYKVIHWSIRLMWIAAMLSTINSAVASALENDYKFIHTVVNFFVIPNTHTYSRTLHMYTLHPL